MKRFIVFCLLTALAVTIPYGRVYAAPEHSASCAVLIDAETGKILYGENEHVRRGMASTTKIMTALIALESISPEKEVIVAKEAVGVEGSSVYLYEGETVTMETLLYALMLQSANDAAAAIAVEVAGSIEAFAGLMNARAKALGLTATHFVNPHGLDADGHQISALGLALHGSTLTAAVLLESGRSITTSGGTHTHVVTFTGVGTAAVKELDAVGTDLGGVTVLAVLVLPLAGGELAFDIDEAALAQVLVAVFGGTLEDHDAVPFRAVYTLAVLIGIGFIGGDAQGSDGRAVLGVAQFRITTKTTDEHNSVEHENSVILQVETTRHTYGTNAA